MNVDWLATDRPLVAEHLHAIDQFDDAIGLFADQAGEYAIFVVGRLLEQLRGTADARQRVLDLMSKHRRKRNHGTGSAAMRELPVHLIGDGALLEHQHHLARPLRHRRDIEVDHPLRRRARRAEIDLVFAHRPAPLARLLDQREDRTAERDEIAQRMPAQQCDRHIEKILRGRHWRPGCRYRGR